MLKINELKQKAIEAAANVQVQENALNALLDAQAAAKATYRGLLKASADGKLTSEEDQKKLTEAEAQAEGFEARLSAQRKLVAEAKKDAATVDKNLQTETERVAAEDAELRKKPSGRIEVKAPNAEQDPKRGFRDHKDFFGAVMRYGLTGGRVYDERLKPLAVPMAAAGSDEQGAYSDPHGNFLVPVGVAPGILSVRPEADRLAPFITQIPLMAPTVAFNARVDKNHATSVSGGLVVTRRPETVDGTSSRMTFEQITMTANEEFGLAIASERIITDSPQSFVALIAAGFSDEYVAAAMEERLHGTGVGERLGVLKAACLLTINKEGAQVAATIKKENIDKMAARTWNYESAVWLANPTTRPQLKSLVQIVGTGGNAVPYFVNEGGQAMLDGRPLFFTERCPALGTVGDLICGNWSQYLEGTYESEQYAESIHARFAAAERMFRFYRRNDGRPWWTTVLTPKRGDTLSPFVALQTRA